jgi:hypothetical protein
MAGNDVLGFLGDAADEWRDQHIIMMRTLGGYLSAVSRLGEPECRFLEIGVVDVLNGEGC